MKLYKKILVLITSTFFFMSACGMQEDVFFTQENTEESTAEEQAVDELLQGESASTANAEELEETKTETTVYVHVCGAVNEVGVYELSKDSRVIDAVNAAGGFTEDAGRDYINLAMELQDGMKITIPTKEEEIRLKQDEEKSLIQTGDDTGLTSDGKPLEDGKSDGLININTADEQTLCTLTGIGASRAKSIIAYRQEHGGFGSIEEIMNVSGIKQGSFEKIKDQIKIKD